MEDERLAKSLGNSLYECSQLNLITDSQWQQYDLSASGYSSTSPPGTLSSDSSSPNSQCYSGSSSEELNVNSLMRMLQFACNDDFANSPRLSSPSYAESSRCRDCTDQQLCDACSKSALAFVSELGGQQFTRQRSNSDSPPTMMHRRFDSSQACSSPITASPLYCELHRDAQRFYCQTCSRPFCAECGLRLHVGHVTLNLMEAVEFAGLQATQVVNEARHGIAALTEDLDSVHQAAAALDQKAQDATNDVITCMRRMAMALEEREKVLLATIDKARQSKMKALRARDEGLRSGISRLTLAAKKLNVAVESSSLLSNPLHLLVAKDNASAEVFNIRQTRRHLPAPEENWMSFTADVSGVIHAIASLGSVVLQNPGPIGDGRAVRGQGSGRASSSPGRALTPPVGRPVRAGCFPVIVRTGRSALAQPITVFGNDGDARDNLCRPWGVACDQEGHVLVADRSNNRIQVYRQDGSLVRRFGSFGTAPGQFNRPAGVAVDARKRIIVTDKDNHRVQILTMEGKSLMCFGEKGCQNGQFNYPWDVAVNSECQIAVSDTRNHRVQLFSPEGIFLRKFGYEPAANMLKHFDSPRGVAFNPEGELVVTDFNNHRILVIDSDFMHARVLGGEGSLTATKLFLRPQGLVIDDEGNIVVSDSRHHRIQILDSAGNPKWQFGENGKGIKEMDRPSGIALTPDGRIVFVDFGNNRVMLV